MAGSRYPSAMRRRRGRVTAGGVTALATALTLSGCVLNACPAIGYLDTSPVELRFETALPADATVSACFESGCEPTTVPAGTDGRYRVPQRTPFLADGSVGVQPTTVRVVVATDATVLDDVVHDIPVRSERTGLWGQCPGPWSYEPVEIRLS